MGLRYVRFYTGSNITYILKENIIIPLFHNFIISIPYIISELKQSIVI